MPTTVQSISHVTTTESRQKTENKNIEIE